MKMKIRVIVPRSVSPQTENEKNKLITLIEKKGFALRIGEVSPPERTGRLFCPTAPVKV